MPVIYVFAWVLNTAVLGYVNFAGNHIVRHKPRTNTNGSSLFRVGTNEGQAFDSAILVSTAGVTEEIGSTT